jgi:hypothetical protein
MEVSMTADTVFSFVNLFALAGWAILLFSIWRRNDWLRDQISGRWIPLGLSGVYLVLIAFFFHKAPGGFDTLSNVKMLFTSDWAALAGWVHYLAFDLFVGSWIARLWMDHSLPRWPMLLILPMTFLFGPIGLVLFEAARLALTPTRTAKETQS